MTAPIDRIENVRANVEDVERQMAACRVAGVHFPPYLTWRLLGECRSLLGPTMAAEIAAAEKRGAVAGIRYAAMEKVGGFARDRLLTYADQLEGDSNAEQA